MLVYRSVSPIIQDCDSQLSLHPRNFNIDTKKWPTFKRTYIFQNHHFGYPSWFFQRCISKIVGCSDWECPPFTNPNHHPNNHHGRTTSPTWRTFTGLRMRSERVTLVWLQRAFSKSSVHFKGDQTSSKGAAPLKVLKMKAFWALSFLDILY